MLNVYLSLTPTLKITSVANNFGIGDIRATSNFFTTNAYIINVQPAKTPKKVKIPDGKQLLSLHICELDTPKLPKQARIGHIILGMNGHSLSLVQLCNADCNIQMNKDNLIVTYNGEHILTGKKCNKIGLCLLPLSQHHDTNTNRLSGEEEFAMNVFQKAYK